MKVPYSWLQEFVPELPPTSELTELLDGLGLSVEAVHEYPGAAAGTVAARIVSLRPIPDSDHLVEARVRTGGGEEADENVVVTGAPNAREGMLTAFAGPGTHLPALGVTVETREMAGRESAGMLLSPRELGVHEYAGGLIEFAADLAPGASLAEAWPGDQVIELELTPNRADAFSILGVARDVAAKLGVRYLHPARAAQKAQEIAAPDQTTGDPTPGPSSGDLSPGDAGLDDGLEIEIEDRQGNPFFTLRRIDDVTVGPSPVWLQRRLSSLGIRPRNNVVDVTNYVTFELGQPSHAYDESRLGGGLIQVRRAREGERLTTLTGEELELEAADLVIATPQPEGSAEGTRADSPPASANDSRAIGLAGVIGGLHDSVETGTSAIALEVAHFDPVTVRRTAKRHGLSTDAHYRFERGVDPELPSLASARAAGLIAELAGGRLHPGISVAGSAPGARPAIRYRPTRLEYLMDFDVSAADQRRYLGALGCGVEERGADEWQVSPPSWRFDMAIEEDVIEEVARLHGYEHVGETVPAMEFVPPATDPTHRALREQLAGLGFQEAIGYVFTSDAELARAEAPEARARLDNPQGVERSVLRTALYPGLLAAAALNRGSTSLALFEVGRVFLEEELERVALLARGPWFERGWREGLPLDFFLFKGLLERLARRRNARLTMQPAREPHLHPGVAARVLWNGQEVGSVGQLHPEVGSRYELDEVYLAELFLPLETRRLRFEGIPRQQHAERDVAVVVGAEVNYSRLEELVRGSAGELLRSVAPFDVYEGEPIPEGMRSVALRLRFRHHERPLTDDEVDGYMENVISALREQGYDIRDR